MKHLAIALLALSFITRTLTAGEIPHEKREFLEKLSGSMQSIEDDFVGNKSQTSRSGKLLQTLLKSLLKEKLVKKEDVLLSLDNFKELKEKLLKLKKEDSAKDITIGDITTMLKDDFAGIAENEKDEVRNKLIALILAEMKQKKNGDVSINSKIKEVVLDYLKSAKQLEPNKVIALSEDLKKELGFDGKSKAEDFYPENIIKKIEEKGLSSPKAGLDLLSNLVNDSLDKVESLDNALAPIYKGIYESMIEIAPNKFAIPDSFQTATDMINSIRNEKIQEPPLGNNKLNLVPIQNHGREQGIISGNAFGGNRFSGGTRRFGQGGGSVSGASSGKIPGINDTEELKACLDASKKQRFNVELKLPGALCASTAISVNPKSELKSFSEKQPGEQCTVNFATAVHCLEGMRLNGRTIGTRISGKNVNARVLQSGSIDGSAQKAVQNGNPDLAILVASLPCEDARSIHFAKIPTASELAELKERENIPLVMQQNSEINASINGENAATIAAQGSFEKLSDGSLGNFLRFNSNSRFNNKSGITGDSSRIRQGDSGGTALTCKVSSNNEVLDYLYLGAISHIDVRGDNFEGTVGGVASGQSLANLSRVMRADDNQQKADRHVASIENNSSAKLSALDSAGIRQQPISTHSN